MVGDNRVGKWSIKKYAPDPGNSTSREHPSPGNGGSNGPMAMLEALNYVGGKQSPV